MSKVSKIAKSVSKMKSNNEVVNFMGGISYTVNPLETLKLVSASSIFGEPQYYRKSGFGDAVCKTSSVSKPYNTFDFDYNETASDIMISAISNSLDFDFKGTLEWARTLRKEYYMRLNPQLIMVLASAHKNRAQFNKDNPGLFREINKEVMGRADEPSAQLAMYLYLNNGDKSKIPSVLKRSWCDKLQSLTKYQIAKYKNSEVGMINTIRLCHAKGEFIDELMKTGTVEITDSEKTWENLRSEGKSWKRIYETTKIPHMALLRNLRNIFSEDDMDKSFAETVLQNLKDGVLTGKQFPFRYWSAIEVIDNAPNIKCKPLVLDALQECLDISISNMPKLSGKTVCLSDNSGSAWGNITSEYGSVKVAEIDNLSSIITCANSDEGYVVKFGDHCKEFAITKRDGILTQAKLINSQGGTDVGLSTENGIWEYLEKIITKKEHIDNLFIYSDMQAGHGGLYGIGNSYVINGEDYSINSRYIDVLKLIDKYRKEVNPKLNVFSVQTAGYNNTIIPETLYRGAVLSGWTGKEAVFADKLIKTWDSIEENN